MSHALNKILLQRKGGVSRYSNSCINITKQDSSLVFLTDECGQQFEFDENFDR